MQPQRVRDRRQHPRKNAGLVVTYRPEDLTAGYDITQTQNVSQGGMLLTTARAFEPGTRLLIQAKLSFRGSARLVHGIAEAVRSRELVQSLLYETRVRFVDSDRWSLQIIGYFCAGKAEQRSTAA